MVFLTFVFAYIQANGVNRLQPYINNRTLRVVIVAGIFLLVLLGIGAFIIPSVKDQAAIFADRYPTYLVTLDKELIGIMRDYPIIN